MSNINSMTSTSHLLEIASANQDLFMGLNEEDGEIISGGYEKFTLKNKIDNIRVGYSIDGGNEVYLQPYETREVSTFGEGIIKFDTDGRNDYLNYRSYNLEDGKTYEFQKDPLAINLFSVA